MSKVFIISFLSLFLILPSGFTQSLPVGSPGSITNPTPSIVEPTLPATPSQTAPSGQLTLPPQAQEALKGTGITLEGQPNTQGGLLQQAVNIASQVVQIEGIESNFDPITRVATARGNVKIDFENIHIEAAEASYNENNGDIYASKGAKIYQNGSLFNSERVIYNTKTGVIHSDEMRSGENKMFFDSRSFQYTPGEKTVIEGGPTSLTSHDSSNPNYHITAKSMTIYPDDKVVMHNATVYIGSTPVLWLPYISQPLDAEQGLLLIPGYKGEWGKFLLARYGLYLDDNTLAQLLLEERTSRGLGVGLNLYSERYSNKNHFGRLTFYLMNDKDPTLPDTTDPLRKTINRNRYRINFQHRIYLPGPDESTMYVDFDITKLSDRFMLRDFYLSEYQIDPQPDNTIKFVKDFDRSSITLLSRLQLNKFYATDTRTPEAAWDFTRAPLGKTGIFYQGNTSVGNYKNELDQAAVDSALLQAKNTNTTAPLSSIEGPAFKRAFTYHELLYPKTFGGWLNVVPRLGAGYAYYWDANDLSKNGGRPLLHAGVDVSFKLSKLYSKVKIPSLGLDQIKHIVQPYVNWSVLSVKNMGSGFQGVDTLLPTTRPLPLDIPLFPAIDSLHNWNVVRVGVLNTLNTNRNDVAYKWLSLNTYMDYFIEDPQLHRTHSNIYNDLIWSPVPWLSLSVQSQLPVGDSVNGFEEVETGVSWMPSKYLELGLYHIYLHHHPLFADSSFVVPTIYARFGDNWGASMQLQYEQTDHRLIYQSYSIHRDLTSWVASLTLGRLATGTTSKAETSLLMSFSLKAYPSLSLPVNVNPGMGSTTR